MNVGNYYLDYMQKQLDSNHGRNFSSQFWLREVTALTQSVYDQRDLKTSAPQIKVTTNACITPLIKKAKLSLVWHIKTSFLFRASPEYIGPPVKKPRAYFIVSKARPY